MSKSDTGLHRCARIKIAEPSSFHGQDKSLVNICLWGLVFRSYHIGSVNALNFHNLDRLQNHLFLWLLRHRLLRAFFRNGITNQSGQWNPAQPPKEIASFCQVQLFGHLSTAQDIHRHIWWALQEVFLTQALEAKQYLRRRCRQNMIDHLHAFLALLLSSPQDVLKIVCPQFCLWLRASPLLLFSSFQSNRNPWAQKLCPCVSLPRVLILCSLCVEEPSETGFPT